MKIHYIHIHIIYTIFHHWMSPLHCYHTIFVCKIPILMNCMIPIINPSYNFRIVTMGLSYFFITFISHSSHSSRRSPGQSDEAIQVTWSPDERDFGTTWSYAWWMFWMENGDQKKCDISTDG